MSTSAKRTLGAVLIGLLVVGMAAAIVWGRSGLLTSALPGKPGSLSVVRGVIGSEKQPFFADEDVKQVFAAHGLDVQVVTAGSRQIATTVDLSGQDFVFPSSAPAATKVTSAKSIGTTYSPFYSPMAIATFQPIVDILQRAGVVSQDGQGHWLLNMGGYLQMVHDGKRWVDLPGADQDYPSNRSVLISSTDIRQSNSAAMYLSIASYVANQNAVVPDPSSAAGVLDGMQELFLSQGYSGSSSEEPFEDYLAQGIGSKPLVMIYEAQFLGEQMSDSGAIADDMVLMYPDPTVLSKHTLVPLNSAGDEVGQLLLGDAELARLAARHGFRPADGSVFSEELTSHGLTVPALPVNIVDPPSYDTLESMIVAIGNRYSAAAGETANPTTSGGTS